MAFAVLLTCLSSSPHSKFLSLSSSPAPPTSQHSSPLYIQQGLCSSFREKLDILWQEYTHLYILLLQASGSLTTFLCSSVQSHEKFPSIVQGQHLFRIFFFYFYPFSAPLRLSSINDFDVLGHFSKLENVLLPPIILKKEKKNPFPPDESSCYHYFWIHFIRIETILIQVTNVFPFVKCNGQFLISF